MTLSDLKTGMIVTTRNNIDYLVLRDTCLDGEDHDVLLGMGISGSWMSLNAYNEDLTYSKAYDDDTIAFEFDIISVKAPEYMANLTMKEPYIHRKTLWTRGEPENE